MPKIQLVLEGDERLIHHFKFTPVDKTIPDDKLAQVKSAMAVLDLVDGNVDGQVDFSSTQHLPKFHIGFFTVGNEDIPVHLRMQVVE